MVAEASAEAHLSAVVQEVSSKHCSHAWVLIYTLINTEI